MVCLAEWGPRLRFEAAIGMEHHEFLYKYILRTYTSYSQNVIFLFWFVFCLSSLLCVFLCYFGPSCVSVSHHVHMYRGTFTFFPGFLPYGFNKFFGILFPPPKGAHNSTHKLVPSWLSFNIVAVCLFANAHEHPPVFLRRGIYIMWNSSLF